MNRVLISIIATFLFCTSLNAKDGWKKVNLFPEYTNLSRVDMIGDCILAVGDLGITKYTSNNGDTWEYTQIQPLEKLNNVCLYDTNVAIVSSAERSLYVTKDGAKTWKKLNLFENQDFTTISYHDKKYGLMTGKNGFIAESFGNPDQWDQVDCDLKHNVNTGVIIDAQHAFVCCDSGIVLVRTPEAGWKTADIDASANLIAAKYINDELSIVISDQLTGFWTTDKGETWKKLFFKTTKNHGTIGVDYVEVVDYNICIEIYENKRGYPRYNYYGNIYDLIFTSLMQIAGEVDPRIQCLKYDDEQKRGYVIDGAGELCKATFDVFKMDFIIHRMSYSTLSGEMQNWSALNGDYFSVINKNFGVVKYSSNSGNSWKYLELDMPPAAGGYWYNGIYMHDENTISIFGSDKWDSTGGHTGFVTKIDAEGNILSFKRFEKGGEIHGVKFVNKDCGIAYTYSSCHLTTDGGDTWKTIIRPIPDVIIRRLDMPEPGVIISYEQVMGEDYDQFAISKDFGETWEEHVCPVDIMRFKAFNDSTFIGRYSEKSEINFRKEHLLITQDAGKSWTELEYGDMEYNIRKPFELDFEMYDDKIIVVKGAEEGTIYMSDDLGKTWDSTSCNLPGYSKILDISIVDGHPLLVFRYNVILISENISAVDNSPNLEDDALISVYPNPADKEFTIELGQKLNIKDIKIYSMTGQLMLEVKYDNTSTVNVESLPIGTYYLSLSTDDGKEFGRMINIVR